MSSMDWPVRSAWTSGIDTCREFFDDPAKDTPVRGFLHSPNISGADCLILTHGAGANCDSPLLVALADGFCATGLTVLRCDLPFRQSRPYGPPPRGSGERDQEGLRAAIESMRRHVSGHVFSGWPFVWGKTSVDAGSGRARSRPAAPAALLSAPSSATTGRIADRALLASSDPSVVRSRHARRIRIHR